MKSVTLLLGATAGAVFAFGATTANHPLKVDRKARKVTYAKDVAPILNERCVTCHRPGEVAPFSLIGYENARKWSGMTSAVAAKGVMPPWKAVHGFGEFRDENRLSDDQKEILKLWHDQGAPRGDRKKEPATPTFAGNEWTLGAPDMVLQSEKPFKLRAEGTDLYRNFVVHNDSTTPIYVNGIDIRPGNKKIVHHVITFLDGGHNGRRLEAKLADGQEGYTTSGGGVGFNPTGSLGGWAPGVRGRHTPDGTAFVVPAGTDFVLQIHYHPSGKPEEDQTKVGLYTSKEPPQKPIQLMWIFNFKVDIPAGEKEYKLRREFTIPADATMYTVMPHMHLLGKSMKSWLELPDGTTKPLVYVDDWDFNWQLNYVFKEPIHVPKGTKQIVEAVYDNSATNPRNPNNPPQRVTWGEATTDEMFLLIDAYTLDK
ncbi:hypothetical protein [Fimbriimonas ginsengisoli]|uniref:Alkyl hydroperoxide reductase/ Thiol specific antioxidant/ Mal allergen n=1 Tax=Fimbriimonas ginsengisoli Gsoil 348 TaxID=661478 RepID=A0A068NYA8_FIMGI|nr:hypothetical protein [Fimbriimonas ginsengisoli]AIE87975.1 alkyl hydroperoxide reductase/ Thiol specific antioxidant/ Mal allergen [Fimbriimonas ginsengisoli Gsoil 348]